jgi:hypothetical protein
LKHSNRVIVAEMMERQGAQCHIVPLIGFPIQNVRFNEMNVLIIRAQAFRDFQGRGLLVYSVNRHVSIDLSSVVRDEARDVSGPGAKIDNAQVVARLDPALEKKRNQPVTAEPEVELPKILQIALEFSRDRLRPIH